MKEPLDSAADPAAHRHAAAAFTLVDLLAVLSVLAIGVALLTPALARTQPNSKTFQCLNNCHQLSRAWLMYADDNSDKMALALQGGQAQGGAGALSGTIPWASGWEDWTTSRDNTNTSLLASERYASLARYISGNAGVFKCPADTWLSATQQAAGYTARCRSVSGNIGLGEGNAETGPWDATTYRHLKTLADLRFPSPSGTWVFLDENPDSINDPAFFSPRVDSWNDYPATYHSGATSFAFADGHAELHKWKASMSNKAYQGAPIWQETRPGPAASATDVDIGWMRYHGGRSSDNVPNLVP